MHEILHHAGIEIRSEPEPALGGVARPGSIETNVVPSVAGGPHVDVVAAADVDEVVLSVAADVGRQPGAVLQGVSGPGAVGRYGERAVPVRRPGVRVVLA